MTDDAYAVISEQYRRESRERMIVPLPKGFYTECALYIDTLSNRATAMRDSGSTDGDDYSELMERLMAVNRLASDLRRIRMEKISRMAMFAASGGVPDTSPLSEDELELFRSYRDSAKRHLGKVLG